MNVAESKQFALFAHIFEADIDSLSQKIMFSRLKLILTHAPNAFSFAGDIPDQRIQLFLVVVFGIVN